MKILNYELSNNYTISDQYLDIIDPSTNLPFAKVPALSTSDIDHAYDLAHEAQVGWQKLTISERAEYLKKWAQLLDKHKEQLASLLVQEIAKPYADALTEISRSCDYIYYTIDEMYRIEMTARSSEQFYNNKANKIAITNRIPLGVVLAISPFNYPVNLAISKIAPALVSGNTIVFKPATQGSVVAIKIYELFRQTGAPSGVFNIVTGRGSVIGDYLIDCNRADMISFTGGTKVGTNLSRLSIMTPHVLELGGKDAAIVMDDDTLNLEFITNDIVAGAFNYSGQRCTAIKRVLIPYHMKSIFEELLTTKINNLTVGHARDNNTITHVIDSSSADFIEGLIMDASHKGARLLTEFKRDNNLIYPMLISDVDESMRIYYEEPFGPVLPIITYENFEEAIAIHNDSDFGLQVSVYGNDINCLMAISSELDVATVNINGKTSRGPDNFTFSGFKQSGLGVQGIHDSIISMTKPKSFVINKL